MRRRIATTAVGTLALSLLAAGTAELPEGGIDGSCSVYEAAVVDEDTGDIITDPVETCTVETFLQCEGATGGKAFLQIPGLVGGGPLMSGITIDTTPPPGSVTEGEGCGMYEEPLFQGTSPASSFDMSFTGTVAGNLDTMAFAMYFIPAGLERIQETRFAVDLRMTIDGESVFGYEELEAVDGTMTESPRPVTVDAVATPTDTGLAYRLDWSVEGVDDVLGTAADPGTGADSSRVVQVTLSAPTDPDLLRLPNGIDTWVWGTTDVPAGITYNAADLPRPRLTARS